MLSACVQMPSLPAIEAAQQRTGLPTLSAATATARELLISLGLDPVIPGAGALLAARECSVGRLNVRPAPARPDNTPRFGTTPGTLPTPHVGCPEVRRTVVGRLSTGR